MGKKEKNEHVDKISTHLKGVFTDYSFSSSTDKEKKEVTISAVQGMGKGFDVDYSLKKGNISISYQSKLRTYAMIAAVVVAIGLTFVLGGTIVEAMSLPHMRIIYAIPFFIFLIPCFIVQLLVMKKVNPEDTELLKTVKMHLGELGYEAEIE